MSIYGMPGFPYIQVRLITQCLFPCSKSSRIHLYPTKSIYNNSTSVTTWPGVLRRKVNSHAPVTAIHPPGRIRDHSSYLIKPDPFGFTDAKFCHRRLVQRFEVHFRKILPLSESNFPEKPLHKACLR